MLRTIRVRLVLSYAGIALLVALSLGAVLLFRLRAYYAGMEMEFLSSNAKAMSVLAAPMLVKKLPKDVQDAQIKNMAFLSQTRVRILDPQKYPLADSGPEPSTRIGFGVMRQKFTINMKEGPKTDSVIVIQNGPEDSRAVFGVSQSAPAMPMIAGKTAPDNVMSVDGQPDVQYFVAAVPVSNGVYGTYLSKSPESGGGARSDQKVIAPIRDSALGTVLGYVELSEGPAYGREIVSSVAAGLAVAGGLAVLLAIGVGWLTSRRLTAPLSSLTFATQQMSGGDLSVRMQEAARTDEFGMLGKSFNQMAGRMEETIQTLRRFLADAAHELQTPLTALRTNLELAKSEDNSPATEDYLTYALDQIDRLQRMIKDLLSLSRLESATLQEAFQPVDLRDVILQISEPYAARAEQAGQQLELDLPDSAVLVLGVREKLCSALENLLDNALKFTLPGGSVVVHLRETQDNACVTVSDTGIGIPPEEVEMLFNRFHRGRNASPYPGSGLGLAIVRAVAQAHCGSVQAANNAEGGARFTMCLPRLDRDPDSLTTG